MEKTVFEPKRLCPVCRERKYALDFKPSGRCGECHTAYHRAWKQSEHGKARIRHHNQKAQKHKRAMVLLAAARRRSRLKGVPFGVSDKERERLQEIIDEGFCELTGLPFKMDNPEKQFCWDSPSLDRIKPEKGYVDGNLRVILYGMNAAIGPWGEDITERMVRAWLDRK
jgi:hypothetical protein